MDVKDFLKTATGEEIGRKIAALAASDEDTAVSELCNFLLVEHFPHTDIARLACWGLLQKGPKGVQLLDEMVRKQFSTSSGNIIEALWYAINMDRLPKIKIFIPVYSPLDQPPSDETNLEA